MALIAAPAEIAQMVNRAVGMVGTPAGRGQAEMLLRDALRTCNTSPDRKGLDCADAALVLSLILTGNKGHGETESEALEFAKEALEIYEHSVPAAVESKIALALEVQAVSLQAFRDLGGTALSERAAAIRARIIERLATGEPSGAAVMQEPQTMKGVASPPRVTHKIDPVYADAARIAKRTGTVLLSVIVEADGTPRKIQLRHSLGFGLDEQAYRAISKWRFQPGTKNGDPVPVRTTIGVNFKLL